jgi:hypothetical protein
MDKYIIVRSLDARHLEELVNAKIGEGYKPQGGLVVGTDPTHRTIYCQAMIL